MNLFGFTIKRASDQDPVESFAPPQNDDGAQLVMSAGYGGSYGTVVDLEGQVRGEAELITKYRQMAYHPEVTAAINQIVNEAIVVSDVDKTVELNTEELKDLGIPPELLSAFGVEFDEVLRLLEFNTNAYEVFKRWYIDGRSYYHVIIDKAAPQLGVRELRYVDPRKLKKIREIDRRTARNDVSPVLVQRVKAEYYIFNEVGFDAKAPSATGTTQNVGLKIAKDAVVYATSGILDERQTTVLGHLHEAIRPLNMLRTMEDSAVIYRLVRAPERRVWYIDVGTLPKPKADQVIYDMMTRHKNSLSYDPATGTIKDRRKHLTMLEDIWLSRREGNRGTQVETLPGSQNLGQMEEVQYFLKKLYKSLNVPIGRLEPELMYSLGRPTEITREEVDFSKFIDRLRTRFCELFLDVLEKQLILKGYVSPDEWDQLRPKIKFKWARDNYFAECKEQEIILQRMNTLQLALIAVQQRYVSNEWVRTKVLQQTQEEMDEIDQQTIEEMSNPIYMVPTDPEGMPLSAGAGLTPAPMMGPPPSKSKKKK